MNHLYQIRKIINLALITAVMDVEEVSDTICSIVSITAVQQRLKCCNLITDGIATCIFRNHSG